MHAYLTKEMIHIFNSIDDGIYITDAKGTTLFVNHAYENLTGYLLDDIVGKSMSKLIKEGYFKESASLQAIQKRKSITILEAFNKDQSCLATSFPILNQDGAILLILTIIRPMSFLNDLIHRIQCSEALNRQYANELLKLWAESSHDEIVIGKSKAMQDVFELIHKVAHVDTTVLLLGETGVGKEVIAREIHRKSPRASSPFVKVNCSAIPESLFESELFGYDRGAFTGALESGKPGMFELANGGTILLDEIGELSLASQSKLLRVLQEQTVYRLGSSKSISLNIRVIAATNRDIHKMIQEGTFRRDLYYRLSIVPIQIPPLRERDQDIILFAKKFFDEFNLKYSLCKVFNFETAKELLLYSWPGNVRQLRNFMERLILTSPSQVISQSYLQKLLHEPQEENMIHISSNDYQQALDEVELHFLKKALQTMGNTRDAAKHLGISQSTVVRKAKKHGIDLNESKK